MLSAASRPYIDASVPVLREHGLTITKVFYQDLFENYPHLRNTFNAGNQASGAQQQSLASAVFAYAANIDNAAALAPVISRIVHKHVSLGITAAYYPIVGHHLLGAIKKVLGDAATPELIEAWAEAYGLLAKALIEEESKLYAEAGIIPGALFNMRVTEISKESELVKAFTMVPLDGVALPAFKPGQYVSVAVQLPSGMRQLRQYSLSDAPDRQHLRVSVKREVAGDETPAGEVSNWLHDNVEVGSLLQVSKPFGDFLPETEGDEPIVLLSAGIGITPMISTLNRIAEKSPKRRVIFAHAARRQDHHPHRADLEKAKQRMPNLESVTFYEEDADAHPEVLPGRMQLKQLPQWEVDKANIYMCGPLPFMQQQWADLLAHGVPQERLHREVFGPDMLDHLI
ncbi:globin domain-containing protein [Oxalicibacterium solurbis]|uniref:Flavohemoprotein n=1 Tax=Oxalicibacterium solurbis TaxID=69280 RepID=A0A8J3AW41_9BURK|nr:globin domain-containing protein [Oxalicibacterium solurbis]GGI54022.1 flavohemoprotein [Oxalicibacterium solurbis]